MCESESLSEREKASVCERDEHKRDRTSVREGRASVCERDEHKREITSERERADNVRDRERESESERQREREREKRERERERVTERHQRGGDRER